MPTVIPSFLSDGNDDKTYTGSAFNSIRLLLGEVQERIETNDPRNLNKIVPEYRVWAQFYEQGTSVARMVENVVGPDIFGSGIADTFSYTLRGANSASTADSNNKLGYGLGSKVLILAILGMRTNYVILSGIRNSKSTPDDPSLGHNLNFEFNGIAANINNDGELTVTYGGATNIDGSLQDGVDQDSVGTTVQFLKDGSLNIVDNNSQESILIDRPNGKIQIGASTEIDLNAPTIQINGSSEVDINTDQLELNATTKTDITTGALNVTATGGVSIAASGISLSAPSIGLGSAPTTPAVQGNELIAVLTQLCTLLSTLTVICSSPGSPSSPPVNAPDLLALTGQLSSILSPTVRL